LGRSIFLVAVEHLTLLRESKWSAFVVPAHLQSSPEFFVRDVQVALCVCMMLAWPSIS
jgi:hypothetical protein